MWSLNKFLAVVFLASVFTADAFADPSEEIRAFNTDRPDKTESAYSVPYKHFQFESDLVNFQHDKTDDAESKVYNIGLTNFKYGVDDKSDLQVIVGFIHSLQYTARSRTVTNSVSDVTLRYKQNFMGNDEGNFAVAVISFVQLPTAKKETGGGDVLGGFALPIAYNLEKGWSFASMAQASAVKPGSGSGYIPELALMGALTYNITSKLAIYGELFGALAFEKGAGADATFDTGLTFQFVKNWQWDAGLNYGLTPSAIDYNPFTGLSARF